MQGFGEAFAAMIALSVLVALLLLAALIVAVVASFVGWANVLSYWPLAAAFVLGCIVSSALRKALDY